MSEEDIMTPPVTVLGVGNIILRDEGFGVRVIQRLIEDYDGPDDVQILDGGTLGMELLRFIEGTKKLLIIDAVKGGVPGTIYRFAGEEVKSHFKDKLSAHEIGISDLLTLFELTDKPLPEVIVLGVSPMCLDAGLELSSEVAARVEEVESMAVSELHGWGIELVQKERSGK